MISASSFFPHINLLTYKHYLILLFLSFLNYTHTHLYILNIYAFSDSVIDAECVGTRIVATSLYMTIVITDFMIYHRRLKIEQQ